MSIQVIIFGGLDMLSIFVAQIGMLEFILLYGTSF